MHTTTAIKMQINRLLKRVNLHLDTLTVENLERERLSKLERRGYFEGPIFPLLPAFEAMDAGPIFRELPRHKSRFDDFEDRSRNDVGYSYQTVYFTSPDTEVLYAMVRKYEPGTVVEVGSGNSTKIIRQAIIDGRSKTRLISIDPHPRTDIDVLTDKCYRMRVEDVEDKELFWSLKDGDLLFIDSSHEIKTGGDVNFLLLEVMPRLRPGVLIHIHDVFLPYDYPTNWVVKERWGFNEQYLVQGMLMHSDAFDVLWAGHFLQRSRPDFAQHFPHWKGKVSCSLWLRKKV